MGYNNKRRKATCNMPKHKVKKKECFISRNAKHKKNLATFIARFLDTTLHHINYSNILEHQKKRVQFATLFQILFHERPMVNYENRATLYSFFDVPNPRVH